MKLLILYFIGVVLWLLMLRSAKITGIKKGWTRNQVIALATFLWPVVIVINFPAIVKSIFKKSEEEIG